VKVLDLSYNGITVIRPPDLLASLRHLNTLYIEGNLIRDLTDAGLASTRVLAKLVAAGNQMNVPDVGLLSRLEYLEEVDFGNNPFECTCALNGFLDWANTTTVTIIGNEDVSRFDDTLLHV
jgi:Leucine-rich repeat (LRR) protein